MDSVARAPMQGLTQFNRKFGCNWCLYSGEWVVSKNNPNSGSQKYPVLKEKAKSRDEKDTFEHMIQGTEKNPCFGIAID